MSRLIDFAQQQPLAAALALMLPAVLLLVLLPIGLSMRSAGLSLKPLVWFIVFFAIIALPNIGLHVGGAVLAYRQAAASAATPSDGADPPSAAPSRRAAAPRPVPWSDVFGPRADPQLSIDARDKLPMVFGQASEARMVFGVDGLGSSVTAARFDSRDDALAAFEVFGQVFQLPGLTRAAADGWSGPRFGQGDDWMHLVAAGHELYAWTGPRDWVLAQRTRVLGPAPENPLAAAADTSAQPPSPANPLRDGLRARWPLLAALVGVVLAASMFWFFWGSAWAARISPPAELPRRSADELRGALLAIEQPDLRVSAGSRGTVLLDWETSAQWLDLMRVHQKRHVQRYVLHLDDDHKVRVREYFSQFDGSVGLDGLNLQWQKATGIQFFRFEKTITLGLQLDAGGRPTGQLHDVLTLDVQALKRPAIEAVLRAGWTWQPVVWDGPPALRWLTG